MSQWKKLRIKDIGRVITGRTPPGTLPEYFGGDIPFITPTDMDGRRFINESERALSPLGAQSIKGNLFERGVAVSCIGWQMGKAIQVNRFSATNQQINTILPDEQIVDINYLYYEMSNRRDELFRLASGGSRTPILKKSLFENLDIYLPPLSEQQTIARILGALDDKIELNRRMNHILEEMARALFKSWFVDFDPVTAKAEGRVPFGMDAETASLFPAEFEETSNEDFPEIPIGWQLGTFGDIAENIRRGTNPKDIDPEMPYIGLEHMPRKSIELSDWGRAADVTSNKFAFKTGEILFGKLRPYFHKVGVAPLYGVCSTDLLVVSPKSPEHFGLMLGHVSSVDFVNFVDAASEGTKMPRTNWETMARFTIAIPDTKLSEAFTQKIMPMIKKIHTNIFESRSLASIRDALLPKLMSGELRVKQAEKVIENM